MKKLQLKFIMVFAALLLGACMSTENLDPDPAPGIGVVEGESMGTEIQDEKVIGHGVGTVNKVDDHQ